MQSGQGADEVFAGYYWYPPLLDAPDDGARHLRGRVLRPHPRRDRRHCSARAAALGERREPRVLRGALRAAGGGLGDRPRAADRHRGDARRRPGQARGQHDDGPRPRGAHPVPRPRARRARGALPAGAQARRRAARACSRPRRAASSPTPSSTGPRATSRSRRSRTSRGRCSSWSARPCTPPRRASAGCSAPRSSRRCSTAPDAHRTNLDGSSLWQLGLLELWLQAHVG